MKILSIFLILIFMFFYKDDRFQIYFGDAQQSINTDQHSDFVGQSIFKLEPFVSIKKIMNIEHLLFLNQMHVTTGAIITSKIDLDLWKQFSQVGDFLVTNRKQVGLAVKTADCLPIVFYDPIKEIIAIAHAGWKGVLGHIALRTIEAMEQTMQINRKDLHIFFGPSAKVCCYEVSKDFIENIKIDRSFPLMQKSWKERNDRYFFDAVEYTILLLENQGLFRSNIHLEYSSCTICNPVWSSHRRSKGKLDRQITVVSLK